MGEGTTNGDNPTSAAKEGAVKWWSESKGYGFIVDAAGVEYFVHYSDVAGPGRKNLTPYQEVQFVADKNFKGPKAREVRIKGA